MFENSDSPFVCLKERYRWGVGRWLCLGYAFLPEVEITVITYYDCITYDY